MVLGSGFEGWFLWVWFVRDRVFPCHVPQSTDRVIVEEVPQHGQGQGVLRGSSEAEFLVSIRHGLLPLRLGDRIILEPYMPHRCAHQFGLDQDIPAMIYSSSAISADLEGFARCWATFLRTGTGSRFLMPKTARVATQLFIADGFMI